MVFWNVAGMSVGPGNPFMSLHVPVDLPPGVMKLQCLAMELSKGIWL